MAAPEPSPRPSHVGPPRPATLNGWRISAGGRVATELSLSVADLAAMPTAVLRSDVDCPDGIGTKGAAYTGVPIQEFVTRAKPDAEARFICVHAGPFTAAFSLESLGRRQGIIAFERDGARLTWEQGGPVRLVVAKGACFDTVKWVERITFEADASSATAVAIVRARRGMDPA